MNIIVVDRSDARVAAAKGLVAGMALTTWAVLFDGDRWHYVERVALALDPSGLGTPLGLASLAPSNEMGEGGPNIIGVWVHPAARQKGIGLALVEALATESLARYGKQASMEGVTTQGFLLGQAALKRGIPLHFVEVGGFGELP